MHKSWELLLQSMPTSRDDLVRILFALFAVTDRYDDDLYIYIINRKLLPALEGKVLKQKQNCSKTRETMRNTSEQAKKKTFIKIRITSLH